MCIYIYIFCFYMSCCSTFVNFVLIFFTYCTYCVCYAPLPNNQKALQMSPEGCDCVSIQLFFTSEEKEKENGRPLGCGDGLTTTLILSLLFSYYFSNLVLDIENSDSFSLHTRFKALRVMKILARYANLASHWKSCSRQKFNSRS